MSKKSYVLAGGGTSGHVNPALAIADEIKRQEEDAAIVFFGTERGIERELVQRAGYSFYPVTARPLPLKPTWAVFPALAAFLKGKRQCRELLKKIKPHAVIGTGGYVCSPVVAAAASLKIPVLLHEQNAWPGRSNRLLARRSQMVCVAFAGSQEHFPSALPVLVTGNPVRAAFFQQDKAAARQKLGLAAHQPLILALGGSLGARSINQAVLGLAGWLEKLAASGRPEPRIILSSGQKQYAASVSAASGLTKWLEVHEYLHDIHEYYAAADLLLCRSGALTCSEIAAAGRPAILVPYPYAAGDHQTYNALVLAQAGAAVLCPDEKLNPEWLAGQLDDLLWDESALQDMALQAKKLARPDAARAIYNCLLQIRL